MQTTAVTQATTVTPETSNIKDDSNTLSLPPVVGSDTQKCID
jgi:hypothetical protein